MKDDLAREKELLEWMRVIQFVELSAIHLDLSNRRARLPGDLAVAGLPKMTSPKIFERRSPVVKAADALLYDLERIRRTYVYRLNSFGSMLLVGEKAALTEELDSLNGQINQFKNAYAPSIVQAYEQALEQLLEQALRAGWALKLPVEEEPEAYLRRRLQQTMGKPERFIASMGIKVIYKNMTVEMLEDQDFLRELQGCPKLLQALEKAGRMPR